MRHHTELIAFFILLLYLHTIITLILNILHPIRPTKKNMKMWNGLGHNIPIWAVVLIEFVLAYTLEIFVGSPQSFKIACHYFNPQKNHPFIFETMIISATVLVMCPLMSFIAAILYYPYSFMEFNVIHFLAEWLKLVCFNFPFAFFSQLFFIQPIVRTVLRQYSRRTLKNVKRKLLRRKRRARSLCLTVKVMPLQI